MTRHSNGILLMVAFTILAPLLDMSSKLATETLPVGQITTARFVVQLLCMIPVSLALRLPLSASATDIGLTLLRALFLIGSTFCFIAGVAVMPIADALAIVFVMPFILMFMGWAFFGNRVGPRRIGASAVGFGGALLVIQPSVSHWGLVALYPLGTAFLFSFYEILTQSLAPRMHPVTMQLHTSIAGSLITVPLLYLANGSGITAIDALMPHGTAWLWLFGVGFWAAVSHLCMTFALKFAPAATLAPLHYLEIVVAVIIGYFVWGTFPNLSTWAGIVVIVGSGLYIIHREHVTAGADPAKPPPMPTTAV